jgi:hypothetical protein
VKYYAVIYSGIFVICIPALWLFKMWFKDYMQEKGFDLGSGLSLSVILTGFIFTLIFLLLNAWSVFSGLRRLAK